MNTAITHVIEYVPYAHRNERCAVGMLAVRPDGQISIHVGQQIKKAKAINPACDIVALREGLHAIEAELREHPETLPLYSSGATGIVISTKAGRIDFRDEDELQRGIEWALVIAVEPAKTVKTRERASVSRLFVSIKNTFESLGWMASMNQGIDTGKIIPRFPLSANEGLVVDFAQQKQQFLALQTVDYRHNATAKRTEASAKLLTLGMADQIIVPRTQRIAVFAGTDAQEAVAGLRLAERICNDVFVEESGDDMRRLVDMLAASMGQSSMPTLLTQ